MRIIISMFVCIPVRQKRHHKTSEMRAFKRINVVPENNIWFALLYRIRHFQILIRFF